MPTAAKQTHWLKRHGCDSLWGDAVLVDYFLMISWELQVITGSNDTKTLSSSQWKKASQLLWWIISLCGSLFFILHMWTNFGKSVLLQGGNQVGGCWIKMRGRLKWRKDGNRTDDSVIFRCLFNCKVRQVSSTKEKVMGIFQMKRVHPLQGMNRVNKCILGTAKALVS